MVHCGRSKTFCFASLIMKNILVFALLSGGIFPAKLSCYFPFGSASNVCFLLKSIAII